MIAGRRERGSYSSQKAIVCCTLARLLHLIERGKRTLSVSQSFFNVSTSSFVTINPSVAFSSTLLVVTYVAHRSLSASQPRLSHITQKTHSSNTHHQVPVAAISSSSVYISTASPAENPFRLLSRPRNEEKEKRTLPGKRLLTLPPKGWKPSPGAIAGAFNLTCFFRSCEALW